MSHFTMEEKKTTPSEILPVEVWDIKLKKLEDPKDLYSAHNACATFSKLLTANRTSFLFPMVFPIMMDNGFAKPSDAFDMKVLTLRLVCKTWKSGVDTHFKSLNYFRSHRINNPPIFKPFKFHTPKQVEDFMEKTSNNDNPFFTGFVMFQDFEGVMNGNNVYSFWDVVFVKLLSKFGKNILHCEVNNPNSCRLRFLGYPIFANLIHEMPALRSLHIITDLKEHARVTEEVELNPLPDLKNLKDLSVVNAAIAVTNELLRAASKGPLQSLRVTLDREQEAAQFNSSCWELLSRIPSLENVTLPDFSSYSSLIKLSNASWSIKELDLAVNLVDGGGLSTRQPLTVGVNKLEDKISLLRLFQTLSSQGDTSTIRVLKLTLKGPAKVGLDMRLNLPLLEVLNLVFLGNKIAVKSLDFVVEMKALRYLSIDVDRSPFPIKKNGKEFIKFSGFARDMKKSNIWTVVPNLEYLCLRNAHYCLKYNR